MRSLSGDDDMFDFNFRESDFNSDGHKPSTDQEYFRAYGYRY
jgi:hypothetical protein